MSSQQSADGAAHAAAATALGGAAMLGGLLLGVEFVLGGEEDDADGLVEDGLEAGLGERGALHVLDGGDFLGQGAALLEGDGGLVAALEALLGLGVPAQVLLGADEEDLWGALGGAVGAALGLLADEVGNLGVPLGADVAVALGVVDGKADEEDVGAGVAEGAETVVVLLPCGVPEPEADGLALDHDVGGVVVEDGGDVLGGEGVGGVGDEQAGLADGAVPNNDTLYGLHGWVAKLN